MNNLKIIGPISIHPDYKRKGYGLKLLQYALEKAKAMGIGLLCRKGKVDAAGLIRVLRLVLEQK